MSVKDKSKRRRQEKNAEQGYNMEAQDALRLLRQIKGFFIRLTFGVVRANNEFAIARASEGVA